MTSLLLRIFVPNYRDREKPEVRSAIGSLSGAVGICCNLLLFAFKLLVGTLAGSVSITADALNNLSDASGSILTFLGFRLADKPADAHHPFGHARAEYLSGLAVAVLILFIGLELAKSSVEKILHPVAVTMSGLTVAVLMASVAVKLWMCLFNRKLGNMIRSSTLMATAADSRNDCVATTAVLLAAAAEQLLDIRIDGFAGLAVALFILYSGIQLAKDTISPLLGESADPTLRHDIVDYIRSNPKVLGYHDLMIHDYGPGQRFGSLHIEMDCRDSPMECHDIIDNLERICLERYNTHIVIHYDPIVTDDTELSRLRVAVGNILHQQDERITIHDFRMVCGTDHTNLIFDMVLPSEIMSKRFEIKDALDNALKELDSNTYYTVIEFDMEGFN